MKKFQIVEGPFGGMDEQATAEAFEEFVGGADKAQRLFAIWKNSYASGGSPRDIFHRDGKTKAQVFAENAKREGFTQEQCDALMQIA